MSRFMNGVRQGRDQGLAARKQRWPFGPPADEQAPEPLDGYDDERETADDAGDDQARIDALQSELHARETERDEYKGLVAELADAVEQQRARIAELEAAIETACEPFATVLNLPGVATWLRARFHPDKYPDANADQLLLLTEATKAINAAYDLLRQKARAKDQPSDSSAS